jgi:hypothetical protein
MNTDHIQLAFQKRKLPPLIDNFEAGNQHYISLQHESVEEYEPVRKLVAAWLAQGWIEPADKYGSKFYRLTAKGYEQLKPKAAALVTMG